MVPGLVPGIQGCKSPGSLGKTWDQAKSLKFILIDSNFLLSPVLRPPVRLGVSPVFWKNFSFFKKVFFDEHPPGLPRGKGDVGTRESLLPAPNYNTPVKDLAYKDLLTSTFTLASHERGIKHSLLRIQAPEFVRSIVFPFFFIFFFTLMGGGSSRASKAARIRRSILKARKYTSACVSVRQHASAYVSIR